MNKKSLMIAGICAAVILVLVLVMVGMQATNKEMSPEDILRINQEVYSKDEFMKYIQYTLYKKNGDTSVDTTQYAAQLQSGVSEESLFVSDTLNTFYQMKVFGIYAQKKNITLTEEEIANVETEYTDAQEKITQYGLSHDEYVAIAKQAALQTKLSNNPTEYFTISDEVFNNYISQFSGDDLKSYTYRILQVGYTTDTEDESGDMISGDRAEKEAYINEVVANVKNGSKTFEEAGQESGDMRFIMTGGGYTIGNSPVEHSVGFLLDQKMGQELSAAAKQTASGEMTEIIDDGNAFLVANIESVEEGVVGDAKKELQDLLVVNSANELVYEVIKDMEVNSSALSRIKIQ